MSQVEINPAYRDWLERHGLAKADRLLSLPGVIICGHPLRQVVKVTLPDAIAADRMFSMLMGEEVEPRRLFIETHALSVKNLDI